MSNPKTRILIVRSGAMNGSAMEASLMSLGYAVCATGSSVPRAVEAGDRECPDVALIDLGPGGEDLSIRVAQSLGERCKVPVIYLTDGVEPDMLRRAEVARPYGYVLKPVDARQLHLSIQSALSSRGRESGRQERDLRRSVEELRRKTRVMQVILNSTPDGILAADAAGRVLFANSQAEHMVGTAADMKPGELYGPTEQQTKQGLFDLDGQTYVATADLPLVRALRGEATDDKEMFIRNEHNPQGIHVSVTGRTLWHDNEEEIEGGVVFFRDVTREKAAEAELEQTISAQQSQTQLMEKVFESMNEGIFVTTPDGSNTWANARMEEMVGMGLVSSKPHEWPSVYGCYDPDRETMLSTDELPIMRVLRGESVDDVELLIRNAQRPEGVYVSVTGRPLRDDHSEIKAGVVVLYDITERRLTAARLQETVHELRTQTRLMQTVLDSMEEGVVVADAAGNFLLTNQRREEIVGKKLIASEPADWPAVFGAFRLDKQTHVPTDELPIVRAMRGETTEDIELFIRNDHRPGGAYVRARGRPLLGSSREVVGGVAIFSDITKYKQTESALEQSVSDLRNQTQLMETVFESVSDGVIAADAEGRFTIFNPSATRMVGIRGLDFPPEQWSQRYGIFCTDKKTYFPADQLPLLRAMQGEATDDIEMFIRNKKLPQGIFISVNGRPLLRDMEGGGGVITFRDVTGRKTAETELRQAMQELRDQSELMQATFNGISDGLAVVNTEGELLNANPAARHLAGFETMDPSHTRLVRKWGTYFYPDRETLIKAEDLPLNRAIFRGESTGDMDIFVRNHIRPEGFFVRVSAQPLLRAEGGIRGGVVIFRDVTHQVMAEEALIRAFTQGRLEIIDTVLHNIGNAINSVTTGIATVHRTLKSSGLLHHVRALADVVRAHPDDWIDYLRHDPQGRKVKSYILLIAEGFERQSTEMARTVERVRERANHIADIIRTQKALDNPPMSRKDIDLEQALRDVVRVLQDSLKKRGIRVELSCSHLRREIHTQESHFHQAMVNLLKNSMESIDELAAREGFREAPRIGVRTYQEGEFLYIEVTDNGVGIEGKNLKLVFAAGYTTKPSGSGLGLHSAANFVIGSGGRIDALSDGPGQGATIRIKLRLSALLPGRQTVDGFTRD